MSLESDIIAASEGMFDMRDQNKFNISLGFFQSYSSGVESDTTGKRFCDLKLHTQDANGDDIDALNVPLLYPGTRAMPFDTTLIPGDELLVLFSDRTIEQWKATSGTMPQDIRNPVKDSVNHAIAFPVVSHHYINEIVTAKLDLLNIMDRFVGVMLGDKGNLDLAGSSSTGTISQPNPITELTALRTALQAAINV